MAKRKTVREKLAAILSEFIGSQFKASDIRQTKGPRWALDVVAWDVNEPVNLCSYDTMTEIVKQGWVAWITDPKHFGPKEIAACTKPQIIKK